MDGNAGLLGVGNIRQIAYRERNKGLALVVKITGADFRREERICHPYCIFRGFYRGAGQIEHIGVSNPKVRIHLAADQSIIDVGHGVSDARSGIMANILVVERDIHRASPKTPLLTTEYDAPKVPIKGTSSERKRYASLLLARFVLADRLLTDGLVVLPSGPKGRKQDAECQDASDAVLQDSRVDAHAKEAEQCADD
jgi:hypothetical protein